MTGRRVSRIGVWDNYTPLGSDQPTIAHRLNAVGYETAIGGKMHFIGPDDRHGFRERLMPEIHGQGYSSQIADWGTWNPANAAVDRSAFTVVGPDDSTYQQYDDEVARRACEYLVGRSATDRPWALFAGLITPHMQFVVRQKFWDMYYPGHADLPSVTTAFADWYRYADVPPDQAARCRAAYYGLVSFCDEKLGAIAKALTASDQERDTVVVYASDHGEMLGEHGLWYKQRFYEDSVRVPLVVAWPGTIAAGRRIDHIVSLIDLTRTLVGIAGGNVQDLDCVDLLPLLAGEEADAPGAAVSEYFGIGTNTPARMLRSGRWKLNVYVGEVSELFDLESDSEELKDLAHLLEYRAIINGLLAALNADWDPERLEREIRARQERRLLRTSGKPEAGSYGWQP